MPSKSTPEVYKLIKLCLNLNHCRTTFFAAQTTMSCVMNNLLQIIYRFDYILITTSILSTWTGATCQLSDLLLFGTVFLQRNAS